MKSTIVDDFIATLSQQTRADLVRLENGGRLEIDGSLKALLDRGEALVQAAEIVERRLDLGDYFLNDQLASLVAHTKSASLYAKVRRQLFADDWALLTLYKARYPEPAIEKTLCARFYEIAPNDAEPRRRSIVDAMRDVGSADVLPMLEAILFDHSPTLEAGQASSERGGVSAFDAKALLSAFEARSREQFLTAIADAILAIKNRDIDPGKSPSEEQRDDELKLEQWKPETQPRNMTQEMTREPVKVFISYKWEDEGHNKWVEKFATDLRAAGIDAKLDRWEVRLGDSFTDYMTSKIAEADVVLFVMTTRSVLRLKPL